MTTPSEDPRPRFVPPPVAVGNGGTGGATGDSTGPRPVGRRARPRLAPAPWGVRDVVVATAVGLGVPLVVGRLLPYHITAVPLLATSVVVLVFTLLQDVWFVGWAWALSLRRHALGLREWGFRRPGLSILWLVPLCLVIDVAVTIAVAPFLRPSGRSIVEVFPHTVAGGVLLALSAVVMAPLMEEVFFRGFLFRGLLARCGPVWSAVISAALFAAVHREPSRILPLFVAGLLLAWVYYRTRSLWTSIALHASVNALVFVLWLLV